jgi:hypothetical protein
MGVWRGGEVLDAVLSLAAVLLDHSSELNSPRDRCGTHDEAARHAQFLQRPALTRLKHLKASSFVTSNSTLHEPAMIINN